MNHRSRVAMFAAAAALAACGVGTSGPAAYESLVIGPSGGTLQSGEVRCVIPPGAFGDDQPVAIIPQPNLLPIDPGAGEIDYVTGVTCLGPRGLSMGVPGTLRHCFDPNAIPSGSTESDLVLLEWDEANGWMRVEPATLDPVNHCLVDSSYSVFGFVAVGVLLSGPPPPSPEFDFVFLGTPDVGMVTADAVTAGPNSSVILADSTGTLTATSVAGTEGTADYLGSRDGSRVLYTLHPTSPYSSSLATFDVAASGPFAQREILPDGTFTESTNWFGWLGDQDRVYHERGTGSFGVVAEATSSDSFSAVPGGGGAVLDLVTKTGSVNLRDIHVSPDRSKVLLQWTDFTSDLNVYADVVDATDGSPVATGLALVTSFPFPTVRWLPDSSGIYWIEQDGVTVTEAAAPSWTPTTLYVLPAPNSVLKDFVVAPPFPPAGQRCAYVREDQTLLPQGIVSGPVGPDFFETDLLAGGDVNSTDLAGQFNVREMVPLLSDNWQTSLVLVAMDDALFSPFTAFPTPPNGHTLLFDLGAAVLTRDIPVPPSRIDLGRAVGKEGHFLVWVDTTNPSYPEYPNPGVYELDSFGGNPTNVTPTGWVPTGPPRWLRSWRFAPGTSDYDPHVR